MTAPKNWAGQKFGKLTAISDTGKSTQNQNRIWLFQCECGDLVERAMSYILDSKKRGNISACIKCKPRGKHPSANPKRRLDATGQVFGNLTAIKYVCSNKHGRSVWQFQCQCGEYVDKELSHVRSCLRKGWTPSCGRFQCTGRVKLDDGESSINKRIDVYKRGALARNIVFTLSREEMVDLFNQPCFYCGAPPSKVTKTKSRSKPFVSNGIDRIDNTQGYVSGNVVPCCEQCNRAKGKLSITEFQKWIERIANYQFHNQS